jgi:hypothetical protein
MKTAKTLPIGLIPLVIALSFILVYVNTAPPIFAPRPQSECRAECEAKEKTRDKKCFDMAVFLR